MLFGVLALNNLTLTIRGAFVSERFRESGPRAYFHTLSLAKRNNM